MKKVHLLAAIGLAFASCATGAVYPRFVVVPSQNLLRGHEPKDDLPLDATCEPDPEPPKPELDGEDMVLQAAPKRAKCIAMREEVFYQMEKELLELRQALKNCQAGPPPGGGSR